ncbi:MAG: DUF4136 domain-containing protein, partial [Lysobacterales bacterium]
MNHSGEGRSKRQVRLAVLPLLFLALLTSACSSGLTVRSDENPNANFNQYRTWNFFDPMGIEGGYNSAIFGELFREAITREMNERGYRMSEDPDLMINVSSRSDDKVSMRTYSAPYMSGAYYRRPGGYYGSGAGVGVGVGTRATKTTEASIFIDLVDVKAQSVSWQGVAVVDVTDKVAQQLRDSVYT